MQPTPNYDYGDTAASTDILARLATLAGEQRKAEIAVLEAEEALSKAKKHLADVSERQIPELMDEAGVAEFTTADGLKIQVLEKIRASIPKTAQGAAFAWLREHGHESLIKNIVEVKFSAGEDEKAEEILHLLQEHGTEPSAEKSVHASTLAAFIKEQLTAGVEVPLELFGAFRQRYAKIK
jgi:predicted transcriptional regulator